MINKGAAFSMGRFAVVWLSILASTIAVQGAVLVPERSSNAHAGGAQIYECVENAGKFVCKFRELSAAPLTLGMISERITAT